MAVKLSVGETMNIFNKKPETLNEAIDLKKKVRESGFPDAFVTATYQGKRIYLTELEKQGIIQFDK